jgi:putative membrane protein
MLLGSAALAQKLLPGIWRAGAFAQAAAIAVFMVVFDFFMEPAAMQLEYWQWRNDVIPLRNFAAWGVFGGLFAFWGARWHVFPPRVSTIPLHAYIAQLGYFVIVNWA